MDPNEVSKYVTLLEKMADLELAIMQVK